MRAPESDPSHIAVDAIERLRERAPRGHCITNALAQAYAANFLLAPGAAPSMTVAPKVSGSFAQRADALPGTFAIEIIDAIFGLTRDALLARASDTVGGAQ